MSSIQQEEQILPRPVGKLPEYAHAKARQTLADKIVAAFRLSPEAAAAIANAVVDPTAVRKSIGEPAEPQVEEISVPGGTLLGIRTTAWARRVMPDSRNPRIGPSRRHPFAVEPGTGGEDAKFRPVPEPRSPDGAKPEAAELCVEVESSHHLTWASQQAKAYVLAENNWTSSIASQGVMEAVWLVATTYQHADGTAPVTTMTTVEGSSRITAVHELLSIRSADVPYDDNEGRLRAHVKKLNESFEKGPAADDLVPLRCEIVPGLILVGFRKHPTGNTGFPTAVKSLVALRHVDYPKPWGEGPENESLADESSTSCTGTTSSRPRNEHTLLAPALVLRRGQRTSPMTLQCVRPASSTYSPAATIALKKPSGSPSRASRRESALHPNSATNSRRRSFCGLPQTTPPRPTRYAAI